MKSVTGYDWRTIQDPYIIPVFTSLKLELSENLTIAPLLSFFADEKTMTGNYHKLDLVNIDAHTKFGLIMSIRSQDIERKRNSDLNKWP